MAMGLIRKSRGIVAGRLHSLDRVVAGILLLAGATSAVAQVQQSPPPASAPEAGGLAEVVVTAERREENIQSVPIAVTAFTAETLQSRNLTNIQTLGSLSPGVNLDAGRAVLGRSFRALGLHPGSWSG